MLTYADIHPEKQAFIFELDGVLYPEKEFYLQVYYLFAHFIEFVETVSPAADLLDVMKKVYEVHGPDQVFNRVKDAFGLDEKYRENFDRLHHSAQFPLKLQLYPEMFSLLQDIIADGKPIFIWTAGNPEGQLNKIRQTEWGPLAKHLRVYFADEYGQPEISLEKLLAEHGLEAKKVLLIGRDTLDSDMLKRKKIDFLAIDHFLS